MTVIDWGKIDFENRRGIHNEAALRCVCDQVEKNYQKLLVFTFDENLQTFFTGGATRGMVLAHVVEKEYIGIDGVQTRRQLLVKGEAKDTKITIGAHNALAVDNGKLVVCYYSDYDTNYSPGLYVAGRFVLIAPDGYGNDYIQNSEFFLNLLGSKPQISTTSSSIQQFALAT